MNDGLNGGVEEEFSIRLTCFFFEVGDTHELPKIPWGDGPIEISHEKDGQGLPIRDCYLLFLLNKLPGVISDEHSWNGQWDGKKDVDGWYGEYRLNDIRGIKGVDGVDEDENTDEWKESFYP